MKTVLCSLSKVVSDTVEECSCILSYYSTVWFYCSPSGLGFVATVNGSLFFNIHKPEIVFAYAKKLL